MLCQYYDENRTPDYIHFAGLVGVVQGGVQAPQNRRKADVLALYIGMYFYSVREE